jgi:hypothetical protein
LVSKTCEKESALRIGETWLEELETWLDYRDAHGWVGLRTTARYLSYYLELGIQVWSSN